MIKGMEWKEERLEQEIEEYFERKLRMRIRVRRARKVRARGSVYGVVAELGSWEEEEVMGRRKELDRGVFVDEDLVKEEREVQKRLRWFAFEEKKKGGKRVEVGYKWLWIEEKWFDWDEEEGRLKVGKGRKARGGVRGVEKKEEKKD